MSLNTLKFDEEIKKKKEGKYERRNDKILQNKILYSEEKNEKGANYGDEKTKKGGEMRREEETVEKDVVTVFDNEDPEKIVITPDGLVKPVSEFDIESRTFVAAACSK